MRKLITNNRASSACGKADGCIDTSPSISHYASRFILSIPDDTRDRNLLPPAPIENQRHRFILAQQLRQTGSNVPERLTSLLDYRHLGQCELRFSMPCLLSVPFTLFGAAVRRSGELRVPTSGCGSWIVQCIFLLQQNMQKWTRDIWSLISSYGLPSSQSRYEQEGFGHYA